MGYRDNGTEAPNELLQEKIRLAKQGRFLSSQMCDRVTELRDSGYSLTPERQAMLNQLLTEYELCREAFLELEHRRDIPPLPDGWAVP